MVMVRSSARDVAACARVWCACSVRLASHSFARVYYVGQAERAERVCYVSYRRLTRRHDLLKTQRRVCDENEKR